METRGHRQNYLALNDGYDTDVQTEDPNSSPILDAADAGPSSRRYSISQIELDTEVDSLIQLSESGILPSESASQSQSLNSTISERSVIQKGRKESWFWQYFSTTETRSEWYDNRIKKRKFVDRIIECAVIDEHSGKQCSWSTTDSKRQSSSSNITRHLRDVHCILSPGAKQVVLPSNASITRFLGKGKESASLTHQQILEKNIIRWVVTSYQPFTVIESAEFQTIFKDIPGISLPFTSRHTLRRRIMDDFDLYRAQLKEEL
ncbi:hypothetical protein V1506DRAFT_440602, partial [Lipomyces tetrasporus]